MRTIGLKHKHVTTRKVPSCDKAPFSMRNRPASAPGECVIFTHSGSIQWISNRGKESHLRRFVPRQN